MHAPARWLTSLLLALLLAAFASVLAGPALAQPQESPSIAPVPTETGEEQVVGDEQPAGAGNPAVQPATTLLDLSGLAVVDGSRLVAVHDGKNPGENERPRASLLTLMGTPEGVTWEPIAMEWPAEMGPASDLESASSVPGTPLLVLAESGDDGSDFQRLFLLELDDAASSGDPPSATIVGVTSWPAPVFNVEGMAVARVNDQLVLLYAERAEGERSTRIAWAGLSLEPFAVGDRATVRFRSPAARGPNDRPVTAIEVAPDGRIYVASAFDSGNDDGPFSSSVWMAGRVRGAGEGVDVRLLRRPRHVATLDGLKVESLAFLTEEDGAGSLFVGTDDEDYGGVLRPLP